jgi:hypothetical protein
MGYPKRVGDVRFIEVSDCPEPILPALRLWPLEMLSNFVKSFVKLLLDQAQTGEASREC